MGPIRSVIDLHHVDEGKPRDAIERLRHMKKFLIDKNPTVESSVAVTRAISLLAQIGTSEAIELLKALSEEDPNRDVGRLATSVLHRLRKKPWVRL